MYRGILVALDGSEPSKKALEAAIDLARTYRASLHALGVQEHLPHYAATVGEVEEAKAELDTFYGRVMQEAQQTAAEQAMTLATDVRAGHAAQQILQVAREGDFDLIVMGARGHGFIRDFLLGTTTDRVSDHAPCSVLVVR